MNEESKYIELCKKLKALAERGKGGEKYNAQKQLDKMMAKYGITKEMLEENITKKIMFKFKRQHRQLFIQICLSVVGSQRWMAGSKSKQTIVVVEVTKMDEAEIRAKYNFYSREWKDQMEIFEMAFIQKNGLFPDDGDQMDVMNLPQKEREKILAMLEVAQSITRADYRKQLK